MSGNPQISDEEIIVGDKIDIVTQTGIVYRSMIEDRLDNGPFLAGVPNRKGSYMNVSQDDDLYLVFYRASGRYIAQMRVVAVEKRGELRYMWLIQRTKAQQNQRREAFRLPVDFDVEIYAYPDDEDEPEDAPEEADESGEIGKTVDTDDSDESKPALTDGGPMLLELVSSRDISITGIALLTKRKYEFDEKFLLYLHLERTPANIRTRSINDRSSPVLHLTATVKRCIPWRTTNTFNTGMQFYGLTEGMSDGIAKYVLNEQQRQIKRRRGLI